MISIIKPYLVILLGLFIHALPFSLLEVAINLSDKSLSEMFMYRFTGNPTDTLHRERYEYWYVSDEQDSTKLVVFLHHKTTENPSDGKLRVTSSCNAGFEFRWFSLEDNVFPGGGVEETAFLQPGNYVLKVNRQVVDTFLIKDFTGEILHVKRYICDDSLLLKVNANHQKGYWQVKKGNARIADKLSANTYATALSYGKNVLEWNPKVPGRYKLFRFLVYKRALQVHTDTVVPLSCYGRADGKARFVVSGSPKRHYTWQDEPTTKTRFTNLKAGRYVFKAFNGTCNARADISIGTRDKLQLRVKRSAADLFKNCRGYIRLEARGGKPPYKFLINKDTGKEWTATNSVKDLCPGKYIVSVEDDNKCSRRKEISIPKTTKNQRQFEIGGTVTVLPDTNFSYKVKPAGDTVIWEVVSGGEIVAENNDEVFVKWNRSGILKAKVHVGNRIVRVKERIICRNEHNDHLEAVDMIPGKDTLKVNRSDSCRLTVYDDQLNWIREINHYQNTWRGYDANGNALDEGVYIVKLINMSTNDARLLRVRIRNN